MAYDIAKVFNEPIENVFIFEESVRKSQADFSRGVFELSRPMGKNIIEGTDFMAKCLCHEIDHLDGLVFIDKAEELTEI